MENPEEHNCPVLVVAFLRAQHLQTCLESLIAAGYSRVYVSVDAGRNPTEKEKVDRVKEVIDEYESKGLIFEKLYADTNMGCFEWMSKSISWFFENEKHGLVIEEDLVLAQHSNEHLRRVLSLLCNESKVMHVNLFNIMNDHSCVGCETRYVSSWGWFGWANEWAKYDKDLRSWKKLNPWKRFSLIYKSTASIRTAAFYYLAILMTLQGKFSSWAFRWTWSVWFNEGRVINFGPNCIRNEGVGADAQHTSNEDYLKETRFGRMENLKSEIAPIEKSYERNIFFGINGSNRLLKILRMFISCLVPNKIFFKIRSKLR